jgi:hypothetical protein
MVKPVSLFGITEPEFDPFDIKFRPDVKTGIDRPGHGFMDTRQGLPPLSSFVPSGLRDMNLRAIPDIAIRGLTTISPVDIAELGKDVLRGPDDPELRFKPRNPVPDTDYRRLRYNSKDQDTPSVLPSDPMFGSSEYLNKLLENAGIITENRYPAAELSSAFLTPWALRKGVQYGAKKLKDALNVSKSDTMLPSSTGAMTVNAGKPEGVSYATQQQGPFFRVTPTGLGEGEAAFGGIREAGGAFGGIDAAGARGIRGKVPQRYSDEEVDRLRSDPNNFILNAANNYAQSVNGLPVNLAAPSSSSLAKQSAIGSTFLAGAEGSPQYKSAIFDAYARAYPEVLEQAGAKNYDDLLEKAYRQLAIETDAQFKTLPLKMSYHKAGEGNYGNSKELLEDIYGNRHMYVFQGGDKHDFLNRVDPVTGLNENEKFRAVHDAFGHALVGNQFGPKGEEMAWQLHQQMYSPLARLAMTAETRGQNSVVNYSPLNAELKKTLARYDQIAANALRSGDKEAYNAANAGKRMAFSEFQFAPNRGLLLPPEFVSPTYSGGMPDYMYSVIKPAAGTETPAVLTHFSPSENLTTVDPARYGTGIRGAEADRLRYTQGAVPERSYFYLGEPNAVRPEPGLGPFRYRTEVPMYDVAADPMNFNALTREANRTPYTSQVNAGAIDAPQQLTDLERLVKEYGYQGFINPKAPLPSGVSFRPQPVQRRKRGGLTHIKD